VITEVCEQLLDCNDNLRQTLKHAWTCKCSDCKFATYTTKI